MLGMHGSPGQRARVLAAHNIARSVLTVPFAASPGVGEGAAEKAML